MPRTKPTYNLNNDNWVNKTSRESLTRINAKAVLHTALTIEQQRIQAGTHHYITFLDQAGRKARKLVKIIKDEKISRPRSKKAS